MLMQLLENVGLSKHQPKEPPGGIPKQWFPRSIRWIVRALVLPFVHLDLASQWVARQIVRPPFVKKGNCKKRGNCCHYILIAKSRYSPRWMELFWHTQINGFYLRDQKLHNYYGMPVYVMGCRYLSKEGHCTNRTFRPTICRTWPRIEIFGKTEILKGCGYFAEERAPSQWVTFGKKKASPVKE